MTPNAWYVSRDLYTMILFCPNRWNAVRTTHLVTQNLGKFSAFTTIAELHPRSPRHFA
jgi:hypothetical protein